MENALKVNRKTASRTATLLLFRTQMMYLNKRITKNRASVLALGALLFLHLQAASADDLVYEIEALFEPNVSKPTENIFKNTTPISSICRVHIPAQCKSLNIFSLRFEGFAADSTGPFLANHTNPREGAMFKVPSTFKDVVVNHVGTNRTEVVQMRIAGVGSAWKMPRPPGVSAWAPEAGGGWIAQWREAPSPCMRTGHLAAGVRDASFFWLVPEGAGACSRQPSMDVNWFTLRSLEFAYELKTPNPLGMSDGQYTGTTSYSVGRSNDFDFGDLMNVVSGNTFIFNFTLTVKHQLKIEVPPGGNKVELVPQGGWQAWLNQGRKPTRLFRDQTFSVSSSSAFKMTLECQHQANNTCALKDPVSNQTVALDIAVSLPYGLTSRGGEAVKSRPLRLDGVGTDFFQPAFYVSRGEGTLHFEVGRDEVEKMLVSGVASTYSGDVTVIWDSEV